MLAGHAAVVRAAAAGQPVYGVTTGLGSRVVRPRRRRRGGRVLAADAAGARDGGGRAAGRASSHGRRWSCALNGLCTGGSGASLAVADGLAALLNAGVHPRDAAQRLGRCGRSVPARPRRAGADRRGRGRARGAPDAGARRRSRWPAWSRSRSAAKDGLAICSSSAVSAGRGRAGPASTLEPCLEAAQVSAALAMEGFRANLSPLDPRVVAARPAPGQAWAAAGLRSLLADGALTEPDAARRLQDPLSFRCASQIHGSLHARARRSGRRPEPRAQRRRRQPAGAGRPTRRSSPTATSTCRRWPWPWMPTAVARGPGGGGTLAERPARLRTERL